MTYDPRVARLSRAEFDELMAILRRPSESAKALTDEDRWRPEMLAAWSRLPIAPAPRRTRQFSKSLPVTPILMVYGDAGRVGQSPAVAIGRPDRSMG